MNDVKMKGTLSVAEATPNAADRTAYLVDVLCRLYVENGGRWVSMTEWSQATDDATVEELWTLLASDGARPHDELGVQQHERQLGFYRPYARTLAKWAAGALEDTRGASRSTKAFNEHVIAELRRSRREIAGENAALRREKRRLEEEVDAQQATAASWRRAYKGATAPWQRAYEEHGRTCAAGQPDAFIEDTSILWQQMADRAGRTSRSTPFDELLLDALVRAYVGNGQQPVSTFTWIKATKAVDWPTAQPDYSSRVKYLHGRFGSVDELQRFGLIRDARENPNYPSWAPFVLWAPTKRALARWAEWKLGRDEDRKRHPPAPQTVPPTAYQRDDYRITLGGRREPPPSSRVPYGEGVHTAHPLYRALTQLDGVRGYVLGCKALSGPLMDDSPPWDRAIEYKLDQVAAELRRVVAKIKPAVSTGSPRKEVVEDQSPND